MTVMSPYLKVEKLRNSLDGFTLEDISFELNEGEIILIGGRNGSGKTSLLETLSLVDRPIEGDVTFFEKKIFDGSLKKKDLPSVKENIGIQFQGDDLFKNLTVIETFELFSENYGLDDVSEIVFRCPYLEGIFDKKISHLSEGKTQLVKFLLSIIHEPKVVFLDEPVSNLDNDTRNWIYRKIKEMRSEGTSFMITLNNLWKIGDISNELMIIEDGGIYDRVKEFSKYYRGCLLKLPIECDIDKYIDRPWVLNIIKKDDHYDVFSKFSMKSIVQRSDIDHFDLRDVELRDFLPEGQNR